MCRVALGKSFLQFSAMKMAHAPPGRFLLYFWISIYLNLYAYVTGHHSVIGRPSNGGLHFPEYVVYRGEQAYPEYLITYQIIKPEANCDDDTTSWWKNKTKMT